MEVLRERSGVEAVLVKGSGGIFEVAVDGRVVAKKTAFGFPSNDEIVTAVRAATSPGDDTIVP